MEEIANLISENPQIVLILLGALIVYILIILIVNNSNLRKLRLRFMDELDSERDYKDRDLKALNKKRKMELTLLNDNYTKQLKHLESVNQKINEKIREEEQDKIEAIMAETEYWVAQFSSQPGTQRKAIYEAVVIRAEKLPKMTGCLTLIDRSLYDLYLKYGCAKPSEGPVDITENGQKAQDLKQIFNHIVKFKGKFDEIAAESRIVSRGQKFTYPDEAVKFINDWKLHKKGTIFKMTEDELDVLHGFYADDIANLVMQFYGWDKGDGGGDLLSPTFVTRHKIFRQKIMERKGFGGV